MIRWTIKKINDYVENYDYILLSKIYKNCHSKLSFECPKGHKFSTRWDSFYKGSRCPQCAQISRNDKNKKPLIIAQTFAKKHNFECLSNSSFIYDQPKLKFKCNSGHTFEKRWDSFYKTPKCPICSYINYSMNYSGSNSFAWKGGISLDDYCEMWSNKEFKEIIKDRDGRKCLNPYCYNNDKNLVIHHIDYNKKNCSHKNLVTVCNSCNGRANADRDWHKSWYKAILFRRYNYQEVI